MLQPIIPRQSLRNHRPFDISVGGLLLNHTPTASLLISFPISVRVRSDGRYFRLRGQLEIGPPPSPTADIPSFFLDIMQGERSFASTLIKAPTGLDHPRILQAVRDWLPLVLPSFIDSLTSASASIVEWQADAS